MLTMTTACSVKKQIAPEAVIIEKPVNIYVTIPDSLLVKNCAEPAVLNHGDTVQDLIEAVNINRNGIKKCQNVINAIIDYNSAAKSTAKVSN